MPKRRESKITPKEQAQSAAVLALFIGFFVAYLGAETSMVTRPHPYHWIVAFAGAVVVGTLAYGVVWWQQKHGA